ncbi:polysaccharide biosynthesis/export family protein [Methylobacterium sp. B4]|uniref:polysaccharide biosynthesis/export family protein n=1 Tax=Methylobacterium sp. B4 TaxID=1938755 RepID=UPI000D775667|nr:polysaccharide biosynthesis/export family protein [Methylobacterium sp. B4]PXW50971.1 polysaccharide export outer membrane protein/exopolysaccharide production protein ExoF [Methylobacterium sp. B4]
MRTHAHIRRRGAAGLALAFLLAAAGMARAGESYRLGPQDQLQVKVSDLRAGTGEAYQWQAFTGEFTVAPSGLVALPVVGEIEASGRTTTEVAADLAERLRAKAGLAARPDASVQIVKFRPFYVMGSVEKPGEYEYRPQLSVLQAVSIAGGMQRVPTDLLLRFTREAVQARGDMQELSATRLALIARQARLDAEIRETPVTFPAELQSRGTEAEIARILREERLALDTRRAAVEAQVVNLKYYKDFLTEQIGSLTAKDAKTVDQLEMMRSELSRISGLVAKGLSAMPRQIEASQTIATLESNRLDVQIAVIRARQDISKADRDILDLKDQRRNVALQESADTRIKLNETEAKLEAARHLLRQAEITSPATVVATSDAYAKPDYLILRRRGNRAETLPADEDDLLQPGDVVRVQPRLGAPGPSAAAGTGGPRVLAGQASDE